MSAPEIVTIILGSTGPLQQSIQLIDDIKNSHQEYKAIYALANNISTSLKAYRDELTDLKDQLDQYQSTLPSKDQKSIQETLTRTRKEITSTFKDINGIKDATTSKLERLLRARSTSRKCHNIKYRLNTGRWNLFRINQIIETSANTQSQSIRPLNRFRSNSNNRRSDQYTPQTQSFPYSYTAMVKFNEKDNEGNFFTVEGKIKNEILKPSYPKHFVAIQGEAGVGKTTTLGMLTQNSEIVNHFIDGVYCMKLGADANNKTVMEEIIKIVKACGGLPLSEEMKQMDTIYEVIEKACEWFEDRQVLFAVDDIWYKDGSGVEIVRQLSKLIQVGKNAAMVYTTRDASVALDGNAFKLSKRDALSTESRNILMGHAQCSNSAEFDEDTKKAIDYLLGVCAGLPAAHGVVGKAVRAYALSGTNEISQAWKWYQQTHGSIVKSNGDEYENLYSLFMTALKILDKEDKRYEMRDGTDCYSYYEMYRGLCVLQKQQSVPMSMLRCLWGIEGEDDTSIMSRVRNICESFVLVGLAEWNETSRNTRISNQMNNSDDDDDDDESNEIIEFISIHDLLHDFVMNDAKKKGEIEEWHNRVLEGYKRKYNIKMNENAKYEEWWKIKNSDEDRDGYFFKKVCRHMSSSKSRRQEIVKLVTRPEWIAAQVCSNGIIQYGEDIKYARECIDNNTEEIEMKRDDKLSIADMKWIDDAVRLSAVHIQRNRIEGWVYLHDRLTITVSESTSQKRYLLFMENNAPEAWVRPLPSCLNGARSDSISIGKHAWCMVVFKGEEEVACGCSDGCIVIVNIKNKRIKDSWNAHDQGIRDMKLSKDGKYLISGSEDRTAKVWDVNTLELKSVLQGHTHWVNAVWIGNGGNTAFTGSWDATVHEWGVDIEEKMEEYCSDGEGIKHLAVLEDKNVIIFAGEYGEKIYRVRIKSKRNRRNNGCLWTRRSNESPEKKIKIKDKIVAFAVSKDETKVAVATLGRRIIIFNTTTMQEIKKIDLSDSIDKDIRRIAWSNDDTRLACILKRRDILIIDVNNETEGFLPLKTAFFDTGLEFINDGNKIVSCSHDGIIKWWEVRQISLQASTSYQNRQNCYSLAITPDGSHFVTAHKDEILRIWDVATASLKQQSEQICDSLIWSVTVSPDGTRIFCGCFDFTVQVVDKNTLRRITSFEGHNDVIRCTDISGEGNHLVTGSWDKTIRIWDAKTSDGTHSTINIGSRVFQVFVCEDGKRIVCVTSDDNWNNKIQIWDIEKKQCIREKEINRSPKSRKEAMILVDEIEEDETANCKTVFCTHNEIRYGLFDNYEVLAILEFHIDEWEYDMSHQLFCVLDLEQKVLFFKVEGQLENKIVHQLQ